MSFLNTVTLLQTLLDSPAVSMRDLAQRLNLSLSVTHKLVKEAQASALIDIGQTPHRPRYALSEAGQKYLDGHKVDNAIVLAAGFGSRFVPFTFEQPKGLLPVLGEPMVERQIRQLLEAGIRNITLVVGYLKESFEYLVAKFGVKLLFNPEYNTKNNLATLYHARHLLKNSYILSSDNWIRHNLYHSHEQDSWYALAYSPGATAEWCVRLGRQRRIRDVNIGGNDAWYMYGPVYFSRSFSERMKTLLEQYYRSSGTEQFYWEHILKDHCADLPMYGNLQPQDQIYEFESVDELRVFDPSYKKEARNKDLSTIMRVFSVSAGQVTDFQPLKSAAASQSFVFTCLGERYVFRRALKSTQNRTNHSREKQLYMALRDKDYCEQPVYMDEKSAERITHHLGEGHALSAGACLPEAAATLLRRIHREGPVVSWSFSFPECVAELEAQLPENVNPMQHFCDYSEQKAAMLSIWDKAVRSSQRLCLCHLDCVPENFYLKDTQVLYLTDWKYGAMADPLLDVAIFTLGAKYDFEKARIFLAEYLQREAETGERFALAAYRALAAFIHALRFLTAIFGGENFGAYAVEMYRLACDGLRDGPLAAVTAEGDTADLSGAEFCK